MNEGWKLRHNDFTYCKNKKAASTSTCDLSLVEYISK
jgi:hypothetical protein